MEVGPEGGQAALQSWGPPAQPAAQAQGAMSLGRYVSALKRYKWLIAIMTLVGVAGGVVATKFITPTYQVDTTIVIGESPDPKGPVRPQVTLREEAWRELLLSFAILDPVARQAVAPAQDASRAISSFIAPTAPQNRPDCIAAVVEVPSAAGGSSPLEAAIGRESIDRYEAAMERLRPADREAIVARLELQQSYEEVAIALGKRNADAARMAVKRALARLAEEMSDGR